MSRTSLTVNIVDATMGLDAMAKRSHQLEPAFQEIKTAMKVDQKEHREDESGPDGHWAPRKASTIAAAKSHHKGRLVPRKILGKLPTAVSYKALPLGVEGESRIKWSLTQQDGGPVGRGVVLPARPFLWISDKLSAKAEGIIAGKLVSAFGGGR